MPGDLAITAQPAGGEDRADLVHRDGEMLVHDDVVDYVQRLLTATRNDDSLSVGASPRAGLMLIMASKSLARFAGRDFVTPDDVKTALLPVMRHRTALSPTAELEGAAIDDVLGAMMDSVQVPR